MTRCGGGIALLRCQVLLLGTHIDTAPCALRLPPPRRRAMHSRAKATSVVHRGDVIQHDMRPRLYFIVCLFY